MTIIIPITLLILNIELNIYIVPLFIILYAFFRFLNANSHKLYLGNEDKKIENELETEKQREIRNKKKTIKYIIILIVSSIFLFIVSTLLGDSLEKLCNLFKIPEILIGFLLGIITSIPEFITFLEAQKHHKKTNNEILGIVETTNNLLISNTLNLFIIQAIGILIFYVF